MDINADGEAVDTSERVLEAIEEHPKTLKEDASFCQVSMISATSLDVDLNLYWDVSGGVEERQERAKLIIQIKNMPKTSALNSMTVVCVNSADSERRWHASLMNKMRSQCHTGRTEHERNLNRSRTDERCGNRSPHSATTSGVNGT